jgi:hypothetical protein
MNWLVWIGLAVVVAAIAAVTGLKPKRTRPVANTRMMGIGRIALFAIVIIFAYLAYRARAGDGACASKLVRFHSARARSKESKASRQMGC